MKTRKKILFILIFMFLFLLIGIVKSQASNVHLNELGFNVQINYDGSMKVKEKWNVNIEETNTLYKTFKKDSSKYSTITNVNVKEITNDEEKNFIKTNEWAYHVNKNYYYGTENKDGDFEIGWGVGLDNSKATKIYEISYIVNDAITKYNDYSELYWQFVGDKFEINCDKITGTIYLPKKVDSKDEIKVWGHTEDLNGTIYATDLDKIEFNLNNYRSGRFVEIRTLFPTNIIKTSGRIQNTDILQTAINEETVWADNANKKRERKKLLNKIYLIAFIGIYVIVNIILITIFIVKARKYNKKNKLLKKYIPQMKLEYFRDIPDETATPGEALIILDNITGEFTASNFGKIFSATMLDLALKGYLEIKQEKNNKGKDIIRINVLKEANDDVKQNEKNIFNFVKDSAKGQNTVTLKELEKYISKHPSVVEKLLKDNYEITNNQLIEEQIIDENVQKEYEKYRNIQFGYIISVVFAICFACVIPAIIFIIDAELCGKIIKKLNVLTQKGVDKQEEWKGLKKYMEDFSMLDKREVPELVIWEKYLVYATAFGIADKVIKQLKIVYPNIDEMNTGINTYVYMNLMMNTDFCTSFSNSISSSISSAYSSGSGSGGGFSGGGGFGRRPEAAVAGR